MKISISSIFYLGLSLFVFGLLLGLKTMMNFGPYADTSFFANYILPAIAVLMIVSGGFCVGLSRFKQLELTNNDC